MDEHNSKDHLVPLAESPWAMWKSVCVRGAGFPATDVLRLAMPVCAQAVDALLVAEENVRTIRQQIQDLLATNIADRVKQLEQVSKGTAVYQTLVTELRHLRKLEKQTVKGNANLQTTFIPPSLINELQEKLNDLEICREQFQHQFQKGTIQVSKAIRELGNDPRYREAITWQNRGLFHSGIDALLQTSPDKPQSRKDRKREELLANYIQRYTVKNDSIGFFGPIGWAKLSPEIDTIHIKPGSDLLATRTVYFEDWGIKAVAATLAQNPAFRPWFIPRLMPYLRLEGDKLHLQMGDTVELSAEETAVLQVCDGKTISRDIAKIVIANLQIGLSDEEDVYTLLQTLRNERRINWSLEIHTEDPFPEKHLRQWLEQVDDAPLRQESIQLLDELEAAREAVVSSAGDPVELDRALNRLDTTFTSLTGTSATRKGGQMYAARTIAYEDCRRDLHLEIGNALIHNLSTPLKLLLTSARWYTFEAGKRYRQALRKVFMQARSQLSGTTAAPKTIDFATYWLWAQPLFFGDDSPPTALLDTLFQRKWSSILALPSGQRRVIYRSEDLATQVHKQFRAPKSGWQLGRYHNPDIMMAAASAEAVRQRDYQFVLGEFHMGSNVLLSSALVNQHPTPEMLTQAIQRDLSDPRVVLLTASGQMGQTARTRFVIPDPDNDMRLLFSSDICPPPNAPWLPISELIVEEAGNSLIVRARDGRWQCDIVDLFAHFISSVILDNFRLVSKQGYVPRIAIDKLIVQRESWRLPVNNIPFAFATDESYRFLGARKWMHRHEMPRFVFVKTPLEKKPVYVDFDSPIYIRILSRLIRQTAESDPENATIHVTEMYPTHDQVWLPDISGKQYVSEWRIITIDTMTDLI